jgi:hypothetical protein
MHRYPYLRTKDGKFTNPCVPAVAVAHAAACV